MPNKKISYMEYTGLGDTEPSQIIKMVTENGSSEVFTCNQFVGWRNNPDSIKHFILPDGAGPIDAKAAENIIKKWSKNW